MGSWRYSASALLTVVSRRLLDNGVSSHCGSGGVSQLAGEFVEVIEW